MDPFQPADELSRELKALAQSFGNDSTIVPLISASRLLFLDLMDTAQIIAQHSDRYTVLAEDLIYSLDVIARKQHLSLGRYYGESEVGSGRSVGESDYERESISSESSAPSSLSQSIEGAGASESKSSESTSATESEVSTGSYSTLACNCVLDFSDTLSCSLMLAQAAQQYHFVLSADAIIDLIRAYQGSRQSVYMCTLEALCAAIEILGHNIMLSLSKQTK